ncbi:hypothetical protein FPCIR_7928 [Fusarium pseudocircinatum]|uniref:Uncharacterized protein n=1 Tax=Fusarium pseudocircinatum TaxID=56676 RepID=A0A8H5L4P1_9HYPO|nr:hypothetical protein FPCIR_7928 [Fusarium pseudocircinatum]
MENPGTTTHKYLTFLFMQRPFPTEWTLPLYFYARKLSEFFNNGKYSEKLKFRFWWFRDDTFRVDFHILADVDISKIKRDLCDVLEGMDFFERFKRSSVKFREWEAEYVKHNGDDGSDVEFMRIQADVREFEESRVSW